MAGPKYLDRLILLSRHIRRELYLKYVNLNLIWPVEASLCWSLIPFDTILINGRTLTLCYEIVPGQVIYFLEFLVFPEPGFFSLLMVVWGHNLSIKCVHYYLIGDSQGFSTDRIRKYVHFYQKID